MAKEKATRWIAFRVAGIATVLAMTSLALVAAPASAAAKGTTTIVTASSQPFTGAPITFTATVTHNTLTPTGTVTFSIVGTDSSTPACDGGNTVTLTAASPGSSAQCSINAGLFAAASPYAVTATYTPDDSSVWTGSSGMLSEVIKPGKTTTTVTSASEPTVTGQPVSFTATVGPISPSTGAPTGSVTFSINGTGGSVACDGGNSVGLDPSDMAQCSVAAGLLAAGTPYTVTAVYSGDTNYATSTGTTTQDVSRATATVGLTSSQSSPVTGQPVSFTATVTGINPPGMGTPTGSIQFSVVGTDGSTPTCQGGDLVPLTGSSAVCNFPTGITSGALTYTVSAILKDTNFKSAAATLVQPVSKASTQTQLTSYPPTITASESFNLDVTFKTVAPGTGSPTGQFEWALCPNDISGSDCTPATGTKGGTYVLPTPTSQEMAHNLNKVVIAVPGGLPVGTYYVFTRYIGNSNLGPSTGNEQHVVATPIPTTITLIPSRNPVPNGGKLRLRVGVIASSNATDSLGAPSGTVTYVIKGASGDTLTCEGDSNVITISTTAGNQGLAKCKILSGELTSTDSPYTVKATYSGDTNYATSTAKGTETVNAP